MNILFMNDQVRKSLVGLRVEHKKRRKVRNPETCCTPPLAEDMLWSRVDEDPLGVYNDLGGRSSPSTPPPLRQGGACLSIIRDFRSKNAAADWGGLLSGGSAMGICPPYLLSQHHFCAGDSSC